MTSEAPTTFRGLTLFPFQREAIAAIFSGHGVLVAAPTGAGKTLVADFAIEQALSDERRVVYTSPIKALSNQKFRDFREAYGEKTVGLMTGDVTIQRRRAAPDHDDGDLPEHDLRGAPPASTGSTSPIFDEVHYLDDRDRGTVWEEVADLHAAAHPAGRPSPRPSRTSRSSPHWISAVERGHRRSR